MKCADWKSAFATHTDGNAGRRDKGVPQRHLGNARPAPNWRGDAAAAIGFLARVAPVDPPAELVTRILFQFRTGGPRTNAAVESGNGPGGGSSRSCSRGCDGHGD